MTPEQRFVNRPAAIRRENHRQAMWECYHFSVNRQDRKLTIRNIMRFGFGVRDAIQFVRDCEHEDEED